MTMSTPLLVVVFNIQTFELGRLSCPRLLLM